MKTNDQYGQFQSRSEVRLIRTLPGPIERVWDYLTDPAKRARWFAGGPMEPRPGGKLELFFRHENIAPGEQPPEKMKHVQDPGFKMAGTILRWEPPHVLKYTFDEDSDVTFELTAQGKEVVLVLTHHARGVDLPDITGYASGWHSHLTLLVALLEGKTLPPFWGPHMKLREEYNKLFAALPMP